MVRFARRSAVLVGVVALLVALDATAVLATSSLGGKLRYGDSVIVPASETVNSDLYVFAGSVTVDGTVHGDLVAAGGTVRVGGTVDGEVIVAGGTVDIAGTAGSVRAAGGTLTLGGAVNKDVFVGSGTLTLESGGRVGGDMIFAAGQATLSGNVAGSIEGNATTYSRTGSVGGTENVTLGQPNPAPPVSPGGPVLDALRHFIVVVLFGALGLWLLPHGLRAADELIRKRPLATIGSGLLGLFAYVVVLIALVVVMVALAIAFGLLTFGALVAIDVVAWLLATGFLTFAVVLAAAFLVDAVVGLALGRLVLPGAAVGRWQELGLLAAGAAAVVVVTSLPLIGPWAKLLVIIVGLGAVALAGWNAWRGRRTPAAPQAGAPSAAAGT